jgi:hypothetical protein
MGILRFEDVEELDDAVMNEGRMLASDPDEASAIGSRKGSPPEHTATWIHLDPVTGTLVYGREMEI